MCYNLIAYSFKLGLGYIKTRTLPIRLIRGSNAVATTTIVAMRGSSTSIATMVMRIPTVRGGLCCPRIDKLNYSKKVLNISNYEIVRV